MFAVLTKKSHPLDTPLKTNIPSRELTYPTWGKGKSSSKVPWKRDMLVPWRVSPLKGTVWVDTNSISPGGKKQLVPWRVAALGEASWSQPQPFFRCQIFRSPHQVFSYGRLMDRESFLFHRCKQKWRVLLYILPNFRHSSIQHWCFQFQGLHFQSVPSSMHLLTFRWLRLCYFLLGSLFEEA